LELGIGDWGLGLTDVLFSCSPVKFSFKIPPKYNLTPFPIGLGVYLTVLYINISVGIPLLS
jgi:hypothetical protein